MATSFPSTVLAVRMISRRFFALSSPDRSRSFPSAPRVRKSDPNAENVARTASDLTVAMAEEALGATVVYRTYTAENYQDKTYDEVCLDRARNDMDDVYLLNPDAVLTLGAEGKLR